MSNLPSTSVGSSCDPGNSGSSKRCKRSIESHSLTRQPKASRQKNQTLTAMNVVGSGSASSGSRSQSRKRKLDPPTTPPDSPSSSTSPDEDSSGGDGTSCTSLPLTPSKISRHESLAGSSLTGLATGSRRDHVQSTSANSSLFCHGLGDQQQPSVPVTDPATSAAHRYVVHISETGLLAQRARSATDFTADGRVIPPTVQTPSTTDATSGRVTCGSTTRRSSHQYRFECELGDVWTDVERVGGGHHHGEVDGSGGIKARRSYRKVASISQPPSDAAVMDGLEQRGYSVVSRLPRGQFNTLILVAHSSTHQRKVVVKVLPSRNVRCSMSRNAIESNQWTVELPKEVEILSALKHEGVLAVLACHEIDGRHTLVTELCENGSIHQLLSKTAGGLLTEPVCRQYFRQMHAAVAYLHSKSVVHRNICTQNFLLDSYNRVKLVDFGSALRHEVDDPLFTTPQGFPGYWLPEVLDRKEFNPRQGDVWALGVCLCVMLTSRLPFGDDESEAATRMRRGFDLSRGGSAGSVQSNSVRLCPAAVDLLRGLLHYVPEVRYTLNRIRCSDWLSGNGGLLRTSGGGMSGSLMSAAANKPYIGNFYLVSKPQKYKDSPHEKSLKEAYEI